MTASVIAHETATRLLAPLTELVAQAGAAILAVNRQTMDVIGKADSSPLTQADLAADAIIAEGLARLAPDIAVVSEEQAPAAEPLLHGSFFLVDPLDGTREFVAGRDEFTVNVALISNGQPLLGIVGAPALGLIWRGIVGHGAERLTIANGRVSPASTPVRTRALPAGAWIAAVSRSHGDPRTEAFIDARPGAERRVMGSAVKFCRIAEGSADIYPRLSPTCEWDVAAGLAVVAAAGGAVTDSYGRPLRFGAAAPDFLVPEFIAWGDPSAANR